MTAPQYRIIYNGLTYRVQRRYWYGWSYCLQWWLAYGSGYSETYYTQVDAIAAREDAKLQWQHQHNRYREVTE